MADSISANLSLSPMLCDELHRLRADLQRSRQRAALCVDDDAALACAVAGYLAPQGALRLSTSIAGALHPRQARTQLGREQSLILFDARDGFSADAFGAVSGTLCGGGVLILLLPSSHNLNANDRFMRRMLNILGDHPGVYRVRQQGLLPAFSSLHGAVAAFCEPPFRSKEQQQVVQTIVQVLGEQAPPPLVLISDRGRGKTSALGLAAAALMKAGAARILVTAPRPAATDALFYHATQQLPDAQFHAGVLQHRDAELGFIAPDILLQEQPQADVLLVDEAAAMPLPMLQHMLQSYPRVVFATTVHGYEGTGRGFALKFDKLLDRQTPGWRRLHMHTPIRWAQDDPLEHCIDRLLCLDAEPDALAADAQIDVGDCRVERLDREQLLQQEARLSSLFALLVFAHYRTQAEDFRHLLNDPALRIYALYHQQYLLGAVLVNEEGGFDAALSSAVYRGERRPAGHLLAQTLCFHAGYESAACLRYARIMRIAVHPLHQGRGLGGYLLQQVMVEEQRQGVDAVGASFGATADLMRFWYGAGLQSLRIGFTRDQASGTHSAVMLKPFSVAGEKLFEVLRDRFQRYLPAWLQGPLHDIDEDLLQLLWNDAVADPGALNAEDLQDIRSCAHSHRGLDACLWPLQKLLRQQAGLLEQLARDETDALRARVLEYRDWPQLAAMLGCSGRGAAQALVKRGLANLLARLQA